MSDLAISWVDGQGDLICPDNTLLLDDSLTNSVIISLFTDARVDGRRGWWGNSYSEQELGSKLWTLMPAKQTQAVLDDAKSYAEQALQWLIKDGHVLAIDVSATNPKDSMLLLDVVLTLPDGSVEQRSFSATWTI